MGKRKNKNFDKKPKLSLIFDENKRKDFLCGFRKRKLERKKKAQEELQRLLKEEKRRIKKENKESYKKLVVSARPIPDIEQLLKEEYEDEDVNVKIVELSSDTLQKRNLCIGENKPAEKNIQKPATNNKIKHTDNSLPGMGSDEEVEEESGPESNKEEEQNGDQMKSKKDVKRILKKQATKKIQKSKVFQMKNKLERVKNKKKSLQKKGQKSRVHKKDKHKKANVNKKKHQK